MQQLTTHRGLWRPRLHLASHGAQVGGWDPSELGQFMKLLDGNFALGKLGGLRQEVLLSWVFPSLGNRRWLQGAPMGLGTASPLPHGIVPQQPLHLRLPQQWLQEASRAKQLQAKETVAWGLLKGDSLFSQGRSSRSCTAPPELVHWKIQFLEPLVVGWI